MPDDVPDTPCCANCRKWFELPEGLISSNPTIKCGECRARAPTVGPSDVHSAPKWPQTFSDDWCGEHAPREQSE